jgi:4,5-DOPA dioxygenase extradiol
MTATETDFTPSVEKMPVLFVGHGNPMNAIEDNEFSRAWADEGRRIPKPRAILCVSAHWETIGTKATAMERPRTIHDFGGFPAELYQQQYPAPGSAALAKLVQEMAPTPVDLDLEWGLDHGTWSVLSRMFPDADVPVVQLSLDRTKSPAQHYALGQALKPFRERGVLIVGSGNMVHNLRLICWDDRGASDWATEFDETLRRLIVAGDHQSIVDYPALGRSAALSIPTNEHYLPLLYVLGSRDEGEEPYFFADRVAMCSLSMRSVVFGGSR